MAAKHKVKLALGLALGVVFVYLAVRDVDVRRMLIAMRQADYKYVLLAVTVLMASHFLRALRWRYFLAPLKIVKTGALFSALLIGYAANSFVPAHLGEVLRAFVIGKKQNISASATFASIVVERTVDVISLIGAMALVLIVHPFPEWVERSAYIMLFGALLLLTVLIGCKRFEKQTASLIRASLKPLPKSIAHRLESLAADFFAGIVPLRSSGDYLRVAILSLAIWFCYAAAYYACFMAFDLSDTYDLPWYVGLVVLVVTTVSIVIPSTPGYVGTYHYLCQLSLMWFGVPASEALSFAVVAHAVSILPVTAAGLVAANYEGVAIYRAVAEVQGS